MKNKIQILLQVTGGGNILKNLNESDHQPAADFTPQLTGSHLQENLHILQHGQPGEESLLRERLNTRQGHESALSLSVHSTGITRHSKLLLKILLVNCSLILQGLTETLNHVATARRSHPSLSFGINLYVGFKQNY